MAGDKPLTALFHQIHALSAWVLLGLIGLHILAALFHRFVLKDEVLRSMLPWRASDHSGGCAAIHFQGRHRRGTPANTKVALSVFTICPMGRQRRHGIRAVVG